MAIILKSLMLLLLLENIKKVKMKISSLIRTDKESSNQMLMPMYWQYHSILSICIDNKNTKHIKTRYIPGWANESIVKAKGIKHKSDNTKTNSPSIGCNTCT